MQCFSNCYLQVFGIPRFCNIYDRARTRLLALLCYRREKRATSKLNRLTIGQSI